MLDDNTSRGALGVELSDGFISRVGVVDVVVGQFLALQLACGGDTGTALGRFVERGLLVRILAVAQCLDQLAAEGAEVRRFDLQLIGEPVRNRSIIGCRACIGFLRQFLAQRKSGRAIVRSEFIQHSLIVGRLDHHSHIVMIFCRRANHRRAADIDILDAVFFGRAFVDGRFERIEIDHQEIDRGDAVVLHAAGVIGVIADREQAAMHVGMQCLDPPIHHFRKACEIGDVADFQSGIGDGLGGAAGGDQFDALVGECTGEFDQAGLVGNGEKCARDAARMVSHEKRVLVR